MRLLARRPGRRPQGAAEHIDKFGDLERFRDDVIEPGARHVVHVYRHGIGREGDDVMQSKG